MNLESSDWHCTVEHIAFKWCCHNSFIPFALHPTVASREMSFTVELLLQVIRDSYSPPISFYSGGAETVLSTYLQRRKWVDQSTSKMLLRFVFLNNKQLRCFWLRTSRQQQLACNSTKWNSPPFNRYLDGNIWEWYLSHIRHWTFTYKSSAEKETNIGRSAIKTFQLGWDDVEWKVKLAA